MMAAKVQSSETVVGNVSKNNLLTNAAKGRLVFDADFESGNLGRVDCINDSEYDLFIRPDTCNPKYRVWFYFTAENAKKNQRVIFNVVNFSKVRNLFEKGIATPVVRSSSQPKWWRIPSSHLFYYRSAAHEDRFVLSFAFVFDKDSDVFEFAYCYPYTYTKLQKYLNAVERKNLPYFRRDTLGITVQKRRLELLTITDARNSSVSDKQRIVFITARVHPGETPASYVCQGLTDFLLSSHPSAEKLRKEYVFKIVPMLNPDGVYLGNYRCSLMGFDLNRHWQVPSPWAHPTVHATKNLLLQYNANSHMDLVLYLDLHAHSTRTNAFMYGNVHSRDLLSCEKQLFLPQILSELTDDFSLQYTQFNMDPLKAGTSRRTMSGALTDDCLCYTLEVSFFAYRMGGNALDESAQIQPYTDDLYMKLGKNIGLSLLRFAEVERGERKLSIEKPYKHFVSDTPPTEDGSDTNSNHLNLMVTTKDTKRVKKRVAAKVNNNKTK